MIFWFSDVGRTSISVFPQWFQGCFVAGMPWVLMKPAEGYCLVHYKVSRECLHETHLCNCVLYPTLNKHKLFIKINSLLPISALPSSPPVKILTAFPRLSSDFSPDCPQKWICASICHLFPDPSLPQEIPLCKPSRDGQRWHSSMGPAQRPLKQFRFLSAVVFDSVRS